MKIAELECKSLRAFKPSLIKPEAPMVVVYWLDAGYDSTASVEGPIPKDYVAGCIDTVVGFYLGSTDECIILAESAYVRPNKPTKYRHTWDIPKSLIISISEVKPVK